MLKEYVGAIVGKFDGLLVNNEEGSRLTVKLGSIDGTTLGEVELFLDGYSVGFAVGSRVGSDEGILEGLFDLLQLGYNDGTLLGGVEG